MTDIFKEDLVGAAIALLRLQDTYRLSAKEIADGKILNTSVVQPFTGLENTYYFYFAWF